MNEKKHLLTMTALDLFYKNGINSVGINEVLKASGVAKKTLYNHFVSKDALIIATLEYRHNVFLHWLKQSLANSTTNEDLVRYLFNALTRWFNNEVPELTSFNGCFFINATAECVGQSEEVITYCRFHKAQVRQLIASHMQIIDAQLLDMICLLKEGAITSAYVSQDLQAAQKCLPWLMSYMKKSAIEHQ